MMTRCWNKKLIVPLAAVVLALVFGFLTAGAYPHEGEGNRLLYETAGGLILLGLFVLFYAAVVVRRRFLYAVAALAAFACFFGLVLPWPEAVWLFQIHLPLTALNEVDSLGEVLTNWVDSGLTNSSGWYYIFSFFAAVSTIVGMFAVLCHSFQKWLSAPKKTGQRAALKTAVYRVWPLLAVALGAALHVLTVNNWPETEESFYSANMPSVVWAAVGAAAAVAVAAFYLVMQRLTKKWAKVASAAVTGGYLLLALYANFIYSFGTPAYSVFRGGVVAGSFGSEGSFFLAAFLRDGSQNLYDILQMAVMILSGFFVLLGVGALFARSFQKAAPVKPAVAPARAKLQYWPVYLLIFTVVLCLVLQCVITYGGHPYDKTSREYWKDCIVYVCRQLSEFSLLILFASMYFYALKTNLRAGYALVAFFTGYYLLVVFTMGLHFRPIDFFNPALSNYKGWGLIRRVGNITYFSSLHDIRDILVDLSSLASVAGMFVVCLLRLLRPVVTAGRSLAAGQPEETGE